MKYKPKKNNIYSDGGDYGDKQIMNQYQETSENFRNVQFDGRAKEIILMYKFRCFRRRVHSAQSLHGHVGPAERATAQEHVSDQRLDGSFAHESDEEELLDDLS